MFQEDSSNVELSIKKMEHEGEKESKSSKLKTFTLKCHSNPGGCVRAI